jgi:hypothetical protein
MEGSGKLGKTIIYSKNKGIKTAKGYKVPYNPDSDDQKDQRGFMANAVLAWKTDGYTVLDIEAWNLFASIQKKNLSGYNMFLRERINAEKNEKAWTVLTNCIIEDVTGVGCKVYVDVIGFMAHRLYLGTSKLSMLKEFEGTFEEGHYKFSVAGLENLKRYYFYVKYPWADDVSRTGIYSFKTIETVGYPLEMGNEAVDRIDNSGGEITLVDKYRPANKDGTITKIEIYCRSGILDAKVAGFFVVEGNFLSTRNYITLEDIPEGFSSHDVELVVKEGDYIGIYTGSRDIDVDNTGVGRWAAGGDQIPCTNKEFFYSEDGAVSVHGYGIV